MSNQKPGKPDAGRKPGGELPYSSAEQCVGGPIEGDPKAGLNPGMEVKGSKGVTYVPGKGLKGAKR